jgi:hypothetical protein
LESVEDKKIKNNNLENMHFIDLCYIIPLRDEQSGDQIPVKARLSVTVQTGLRAQTASHTVGSGSFPGVKSGRVITLTTHRHLVPRLKKE